MKVFVGTLESGEADLPWCLDAIRSQRDVEFEHFIVSGLPEEEAHKKLYTKWNAVKTDFDLFLKVDADTVLANQYVIKTYVELFTRNNRLTGVQAWLYDYMTDERIYGLNCVKNTVTIDDKPNKLYCDHVDTDHDVTMRGYELSPLLNPAGYHCLHASEIQAFHYGVHRGKKGQTAIKNSVQVAFKRDKTNRIRGFALLGFKMASECNNFDYTGSDFHKLYERAQREYDVLLGMTVKQF